MVGKDAIGDDRRCICYSYNQVDCGLKFRVGCVFNVVVSFDVVGVGRLQRATRRIFVVLLFEVEPLRLYWDDPAQRRRVLDLERDEGMFHPGVDLCTGGVFLFFQDR